MQSRIKTGLKYLCCWALLLQMLNLSIDPARHANYIDGQITFQEDLSINKIESFSELLLEKLFDKNIPEIQDQAHHSLVKAFFFFHQNPTVITEPILIELPVRHNHLYIEQRSETSKSLESPPPRLTV
ncbi:MAG: hypothetical protein EOO90_22175 [Pedobacter sp.]|nr:MAG: hypothetical protein EOO90_22175 [Pedobacter sp.]